MIKRMLLITVLGLTASLSLGVAQAESKPLIDGDAAAGGRLAGLVRDAHRRAFARCCACRTCSALAACHAAARTAHCACWAGAVKRCDGRDAHGCPPVKIFCSLPSATAISMPCWMGLQVLAQILVRQGISAAVAGLGEVITSGNFYG